MEDRLQTLYLLVLQLAPIRERLGLVVLLRCLPKHHRHLRHQLWMFGDENEPLR